MDEGNAMAALKRRPFLAGAASALAAPIISRAWAAASVLKFIPATDLTSLDPIWTTDYRTRNHAFAVFDTLYGQTGPSQGFKATPQMLAGHTVENDGLTWRLTLRGGLTFHDGQKVLARDCVASIRRWCVRDAFGQALMQRTDELRAVDDRVIMFRLKEPFPLLPGALGKSASNMCAIMPERLALTDPFKQVSEVVGSGPFRFKADERVQGALVVYERFPDYRPREDGSPDWTSGPKITHFDRVEWHVIPDEATALNALRLGEVDWMEVAPADLLDELRQDRDITLDLLDPTGFSAILRPNHLYPPFDNRAVRHALLGAIDQTDFMTAAVGTDRSQWQTPIGYFAPSSPLATEAGMPTLTGKRDYNLVRTALESAGYKGEKIVLMGPADFPILTAVTEVAADMLRKSGMNVDYQTTDWGTVIQRRALRKPPDQGGWNMFCTSLAGLDVFSPAGNQALRGNGAAAWFGWPSDPDLERLREAWFAAPDLGAQKKIAAEIQIQAFQDVPYYPLGLYYRQSAYRANLSGVLHGIPVFWNVQRT
jgi:peptide/nickel transport system substrate-binding protein